MKNSMKVDFIKIAKEENRNLFAGPKNGKNLYKKISHFWNRNKFVELYYDKNTVISSSFYFGLVYPLFKNKDREYISSHIMNNGEIYKKENNPELERAIRRIIEKKKKWFLIF